MVRASSFFDLRSHGDIAAQAKVTGYAVEEAVNCADGEPAKGGSTLYLYKGAT